MALTAKWQGDAVLVEWETAFEIDLTGFDILRARSPEGQRTQINSEVGFSQALDGSGAVYQYLDQTVIPDGTYYWLVTKDVHGLRVALGPASVGGHRLCLPAMIRARQPGTNRKQAEGPRRKFFRRGPIFSGRPFLTCPPPGRFASSSSLW